MESLPRMIVSVDGNLVGLYLRDFVFVCGTQHNIETILYFISSFLVARKRQSLNRVK